MTATRRHCLQWLSLGLLAPKARRLSAGEQSSPAQTAEGFTGSSLISDIIHDPSFSGFGRLLFPLGLGSWRGKELKDLSLPWYTCIDPQKSAEIVNFLRARALSRKPVFFDIYTEKEKADDPRKADTGLFYFGGRPGARFAVCSAGGGFVYVGAMHDSFPHALELARQGFHAFALIYRPGARTACEDLARAVSWIFEHAGSLGIDVSCYSLWGGSAGARMAAWVGGAGSAAFGGGELPKPGAVIMQNTGLADASPEDPPTFAAAGGRDGIADARIMKARIDRLKTLGIPAEFVCFPTLGHGFGLGTGTEAEGWLKRALAFWKAQMPSS